jgi:HlyD family secretion protein
LLFKPAGAASGGGSRGSASGGFRGAPGASGGSEAAGSAAAQSGSSTVAGAQGSRAAVWVLRAGKPVAVRIVIGISDGRNYEVLSGQLQLGDQVIIGQLQAQQVSGGTTPITGGRGFGG